MVPELLDHLRSTFSPESKVTYDEVFEKVKTSPLLILDDLGTRAAPPGRRRSSTRSSTTATTRACPP